MSDDIMYDSKEDCYMVPEEQLKAFENAVEELSSLKSRLPVNADGDVVLWGDLQEYSYGQVARVEIIEKCPHPVNGIRDRWQFEFDNEDYDYADNCHSTAESCRAANTDQVPEGGK